MKWRRSILVGAIAGVVVAIIAATAWRREREPEYQGKKLSQWLDTYAIQKSGPAHEGAASAVRSIGTNALPFLIRWLEYRPPAWKVQVRRLARWLKSKGWGVEMLFRVLLRGDLRRAYAVKGFEILGESAGAAWPDLARIAGQGRPEALLALGRLGKYELPALGELVTNAQLRVRDPGIPIYALGRMSYLGKDLGTNARCLVPALVQSLGDPLIAVNAARVLGEFRLESEVSIPALMSSMESSDPMLRRSAAMALGSFGREAKAAVPVLVRALDEAAAAGDVSMRQEVRNALGLIAPEVLKGSGDRKEKSPSP